MKSILLWLIGLFAFIMPMVAFSAEYEPNLDTKDKIEEAIIVGAMARGLSVTKALYIARCESGLIPTAKNPNSTASGIYQFINSTWYGTMKSMGLPTTTSKLDPKANIDAGLHLLKTSGDHHWNESKPCWGPKVAEMMTG